MARTRRPHAEAVRHAERRSVRVMWAGVLIGSLAALGAFVAPKLLQPAEETASPVEIRPSGSEASASKPAIETLRVQVLKRYPHDASAFTQGLIWHEGVLYESTGQYGRSSLRRVRLDDGKILAERRLDGRLFGEGLARVGERLIQLTWRAGKAIVSDIASLELRETLPYQGEGWGLCFDGNSLVMSNGSSTLAFRDPKTMELQREITVRREGRPVRMLNELECVGSVVYANIWRRNQIVRIDPNSGTVTAVVDASGLLSREEAIGTDVLNGIAYRPDTKTFLVTGKLWPAVFEVAFIPQ